MSKYPAIASGQTIDSTMLRGMLPEIIVKAATTDRASTTSVATDPDLRFVGEAGASYMVEFHLMPAAILAADFKTIWTVPANSSGFKSVLGPGSAASDTSADGIAMRSGIHNFSTEILYSGVRNDNTLGFAVREFGIVTLTTQGTICISWAQGTSSATATRLFGGSFMKYRQIA